MKAKVLRLSLILIVFSCLFQKASAQHGNEWINYNQQYIKISVGKTASYRIDYFTLIDAAIDLGFNLSAQDPRKIQMFHNGAEVPIYVAGEADGKFNSYDFIEFYGEINDGQLDKGLYENPGDQPHDRLSLITDSTAYYLTFGTSGTPLRLKNYGNSSYGSYTAQPFFLQEEFKTYSDDYFYGEPYPIISNTGTTNLYFSEYTTGEGHSSRRFGFGQGSVGPIRTETINSKFYEPSGPAPVLSYKFYGVTD
ncbi:MAG: hypothetical protein H7321_01575, partial [Bacteroidia bacterium]|nr:hypothetical protein [Bacteroidia bacterium]